MCLRASYQWNTEAIDGYTFYTYDSHQGQPREQNYKKTTKYSTYLQNTDNKLHRFFFFAFNSGRIEV